MCRIGCQKWCADADAGGDIIMEGGEVTHGATLATQGFELALPASGMLPTYHVSCALSRQTQ